MANPFSAMNPLNANNPQLQYFQQIYKTFCGNKNPQQLFQQMAMRNPQMQQIANMLRNGANPQELFNQVCQRKGINPQQLIKMIKG